MKILATFLTASLLVFLTGCATDMAAGYGGGSYGSHGQVAVGVHGHGNGAAVVGALIVGGIIGNAIAESNKQKNLNQSRSLSDEQDSRRKSADELANGYSIDPPSEVVQQKQQHDQQSFNQNQRDVQWYQVGKDGNCYLMGVTQGITDVISAVPGKKCQH